MATDYADNGFNFTDLRVEEAVEYCRDHGIARREWRDTSAGPDGSTSGLYLTVGTRSAVFRGRFRVDGRPRTVTVGPAAGRGRLAVAEARKRCHRLRFGGEQVQPQRKRRGAPAGITVEDCFRRYIEDAGTGRFTMSRRNRRPLAVGTIKDRQSIYNAHMAEYGSRNLRWLAENALQQFEQLGTQPDDEGKTHPSLANQFKRLVRPMFQWAEERGIWTEPNPVNGRAWENFETRHRDTNLNDEQAERLLAAIRTEPQWFDMFVTLAMLGRRLGEIRELTWDRVDIRKRTIRFNARQPVAGKQQATTKTGAAELIPIPDDVLAILKARKLHRDPGTDGGYVFPSTVTPGKPVSASGSQKAWDRVRALVGLNHVVLHGLRHNAASWAAEDNCSNSQLKGMTGHKSDEALAKYTHARQVVLAKPAQESVQARWREAAAADVEIVKPPRKVRSDKGKARNRKAK